MLKLTDEELCKALGIIKEHKSKPCYIPIRNNGRRGATAATSKVCWKLWQILMELGYRAAARKVKAILEAEGIEEWREG